MRQLRLLMAIAVAVTAVACSGISVETVFDDRFDFADLDTYRWAPKEPEAGPDMPYDLIDRIVRESIDDQLAMSGFTKRDRGPTNFQVVYYIGVEEVTRVTQSYYGAGWGSHWGYGWYGAPYGGGVNVTQYDQGALTIDIIDSDTGLVWRGVAKGRVSSSMTSEKLREGLNEAVVRILERFPPAPQTNP